MKIIFLVAALLLTCVSTETIPVKLYNYKKDTRDYFVVIENAGDFLIQQLMKGTKIDYVCDDKETSDLMPNLPYEKTLIKIELWKSNFNSPSLENGAIDVKSNITPSAEFKDFYDTLKNENSINSDTHTRYISTLNCKVDGKTSSEVSSSPSSTEPNNRYVKSSTQPRIMTIISNLNPNISETILINFGLVPSSNPPHSSFPSSLCKHGKGSCAECLTGRHDCSNFNAECVTHVTPFTSVYLCKCLSNGFVFSPICHVSTPGFKFHCPCAEGKVYNAAKGSCNDIACENGGHVECEKLNKICRQNPNDRSTYECLCPDGKVEITNGSCVANERTRHERVCHEGMFLGPDQKCIFLHDVKLSIVEKYQIVREGQTIVIRCRDEGRFHFKPKWTRPVSENKLSDWASQLGDRLYINSSQPLDNGVYICYVGNEYSKDEPNQIARVKVKPNNCVDVSVVINVENRVEFVEGKDVQLSCQDEGANNYPVKWYREDNRELPTNTSVLEGGLLIKDAHPTDNGLYVCEANSINSTISCPPSCSKDYIYINIRPLRL